MNLPLDSQIESLLFFKGEPFEIKKLSEILNTSEDEVKTSLEVLKTKLEGRGIILVVNDNKAVLTTHSEMSEIIESISKDELSRELSKAALETLSIILYRGPVTRSQIDYIRGVNSQFILRNLLIRGLIEKIQNPKDDRSFLYQPEFKLLEYLGINKKEEMPEFEQVEKDIETFMNQKDEENNEELA